MDISDTIIARSDQLNSDDLIGGPITVQITGVDKVTGEQPVEVRITGGHKPWKPCKTMRRLLVHAWGAEAGAWAGKWLTLYRDPTVRFGGDDVGGIRVSHLSGIERAITINLTATRGKKALHRVAVLVPPGGAEPMPLDKFLGWIGAASKRGWTSAHLAALFGCDRAEDVAPDARRGFVATLKGPPPSEDDPPVDDEEANRRAADRDAAEHGKGGGE